MSYMEYTPSGYARIERIVGQSECDLSWLFLELLETIKPRFFLGWSKTVCNSKKECERRIKMARNRMQSVDVEYEGDGKWVVWRKP